MGIKRQEIAIRPLSERLKIVCEELGPTFIKLGQIASTRTDIFPEELTEALARLQDQVKPEPFSIMKDVVENEIGPINKVFTELNETPIGSASIAQVYLAKIENTPVIVKVRRPNIERMIDLDIDMFKRIARIAEINIPGFKERNPQDLIETFARTLCKELDFLNEAANAEKFKEIFQNDHRIKIPRVFKEISTSRVLIQEYISGIKITDIKRIQENSINPKIIAENGADIFLKQILIDGFFHADPHPGNIFVQKDNIIVPIDFGMVGRITPAMKEQLGNFILGIVNRDARKIAKAFLKIGAISKGIDEDMLQQDILYILDKFESRAIKHISVKEFVMDINRVIRKYQIRIPQDLLYLGKALSQLEMIGKELDENFDIMGFAQRFVHKHNFGVLSVNTILNKGRKWLESMLATLFELPDNINNLFETIQNMNKKDINKKTDRHIYWYMSGFGIMVISMFIIMIINHPVAKILGIIGIGFAFLIFVLQLIYSFFSY